MAKSTGIDRNWLMMLHSGVVVIDWGDGLYQEIVSGKFLHCNAEEISHIVTEAELMYLKKVGRIDDFDSRQVFLHVLPERPSKTLD